MNDERGVVEREVFISASPEAVFRFLIDPALMAHWMGSSDKLEPRPGGIFEVEVSPGNIARGVFTEVTPPHRVAFTWGWDSEDPELAILPPGNSLSRSNSSERRAVRFCVSATAICPKAWRTFIASGGPFISAAFKM